MADGGDREAGASGENASMAVTTAEEEGDKLVARAQRLISRINESQEDPDPRRFHALASMLEEQQARYAKESADSSFSGNRLSHAIGKLENFIHENDEFVLSLSTKYLAEAGYSVGVRAAAARLLLGGASSWMILDDVVTENAKTWLMEDTLSDFHLKNEMSRDMPSDAEMLKTYSAGILAMCLTTGGELVEDVLSAGLSSKLMRYLRLRVLGDLNAVQKDANLQITNKHASATTSVRIREDGRSRLRHSSDAARLDGLGGGNENPACDSRHWKDPARCTSTSTMLGEDLPGDHMASAASQALGSSFEVFSSFDRVNGDVEIASGELHVKDPHDLKLKRGERHGNARPMHGEGIGENSRNDPSRSRCRAFSKTRERGGGSDGFSAENKRVGIVIAGSDADDLGQCVLSSGTTNADNMKAMTGTKICTGKVDFDSSSAVDAHDDRANCAIGSKDISDVVKKAIQAAEAEARTANAPPEAITAAGDAAADLVKTSALEVWKNSNDIEAAVLAASEAAFTIIDASVTSEKLRLTADMEVVANTIEDKKDDDDDDFFILDCEALALLRDKYSIECLEILGEYMEALGPVLHEKGVDVCLALLHRSMKLEAVNNLVLLPKVLKLICALAAHRKFAALFVDRGGMQKLLSVERIPETFLGLSSCLFTIGTQAIMERVCALPASVVDKVVELALQLLECSQDLARKNAAIFFNSAFVFRAILDSFDEQEGLQKMLNFLQSTASVRSGGNSGTPSLSNVGYPNDRPPTEVLTASEKQLAYHTCIALRQYFRAHLVLLLDSLRPNKASRSTARSNSVARAAYKPLDISNEAMDSVFLHIQRDRKIGPAFVRARWDAVDKFLFLNGHITMLELCQAPAIERYLHDLAQYALGVLHIVTLVAYSRRLIVNAALSNDRIGMAVILDALNGAGGFVDPEVICPALDVLVNLVCPPPSISIKPPASSTENRERNSERNVTDRSITVPVRLDHRDRNGEPLERSLSAVSGAASSGSSSQTVVPSVSSGLVGDRRISLGPGAGCAGLAAQLEQGYRQAREAVRANNGIKVLLHLLHPRMLTPPMAQDRIRALACRVLLGLARDDAIAHILTKLQVGKKLSELIRDSGGQSSGSEQDRWQHELVQVAIELIAIVTNSGRASTLVATDAAAPTLRRIERAAIAAATPITYHSRELLLLILEHLQLSGLTATAALLQKEASLAPLPSLTGPQPPLHQTSIQEIICMPRQWPSGRSSCGFLTNAANSTVQDEDSEKSLSAPRKKKLLLSNTSFARSQMSSQTLSIDKGSEGFRRPLKHLDSPMTPSSPSFKVNADADRLHVKSPILLPLKRKLIDCKDSAPQSKRLASADAITSPCYQTPITPRRSTVAADTTGLPQPSSRDQNRTHMVENSDHPTSNSTSRSLAAPGFSAEAQLAIPERMTLDSLVVQYLKHQHRQCPAPITTLPPISLLHPHMCPEPSRRLDASANVTARVSSREFRKIYGGIHAHRRDRQFVHSRFKQWRNCRDDVSPSPLTCITFLGDTSRFATGSKSGELKIFDSNSGQVLESFSSHQSLVTLIQSTMHNETQMLLSSSSQDVNLWDASLVSAGPLHTFEGCKAARFSHSGTMFAALSTDASSRDILLYDINKYDVEQKLQDNSGGNGQTRMYVQSLIHFTPLDTMLLWNGTLWDRRSSTPIHNFDQFSDYGGGGFHPSGNEVIINSEVWDLRKFKLLRSVPSLDQTFISFNTGGDIIYATLRRNLDDLRSALNVRRLRQPLSAAFRTMDAINYSDIATIPVDRCVLDFATEPTDSVVGLITMDDHEELYSSARIYEIGRRRPTDDDSDPDDGVDSDEDEDDEDEDSDEDVRPLLGSDLDGEGDSDVEADESNEEADSGEDLDDDVEFTIGDVDLDGQGRVDVATDGEDDESDMLDSGSDETDFGF